METKTFLERALGNEGSYCVFAFRTRDDKRLQKFYTSIDHVIDVATNLDKEGSSVEAEVALVSIDVNESNKKNIYQICDFYRARKIENENNLIIFEIAGASDRINRFIKEISEITKNEIVRSGPVAISTFENSEVKK